MHIYAERKKIVYFFHLCKYMHKHMYALTNIEKPICVFTYVYLSFIYIYGRKICVNQNLMEFL